MAIESLSPREMYEDAGMSLREISRVTGIPFSTLRHRLMREGVEFRPPGGCEQSGSRLPHKEIQLTAMLYASGLSARATAAKLGITETTVLDRLKKHGMPRRPRSMSRAARMALANKR